MKYCSCTLGMIGFSKEASSFFQAFSAFPLYRTVSSGIPKISRKRVKNPIFIFPLSQSTFTGYHSEVPPAARKIPDDPIGKRKGTHLIAKLLQGLSCRFLPFPEAKEYIPGISSLCTSEDRIAGS